MWERRAGEEREGIPRNTSTDRQTAEPPEVAGSTEAFPDPLGWRTCRPLSQHLVSLSYTRVLPQPDLLEGRAPVLLQPPQRTEEGWSQGVDQGTPWLRTLDPQVCCWALRHPTPAAGLTLTSVHAFPVLPSGHSWRFASSCSEGRPPPRLSECQTGSGSLVGHEGAASACGTHVHQASSKSCAHTNT